MNELPSRVCGGGGGLGMVQHTLVYLKNTF